MVGGVKIIFAMILAAAAAAAASGTAAQSVCDLTMADLPAIRGFRLGDTRKEVNAAFEQMAFVQSSAAGSRLDSAKLENVWTEFYQDRLSAFELDFAKDPEWKTVTELAAALHRRGGLPLDGWVFVDTTEAMMDCRDFRASISTVRNTLSLTDTFARAALKQQIERSGKTRPRITPAPGN